MKGKIIRHTESKKKNFLKRQQESEPDMTEILELPDQKFKTTMIKMPRALTEKLKSMQEQMGNVNQRDGNSEKDPKKKKSQRTKTW